uniref:Putative NMDtranscript(AltDon_e2) n=1 Tax=Homo sapiens TaxID=9606 RepID=A0A8D9UJB7_HUMAN|nr:TPA_inf: putative NMDtranscript(altDon_e2) [Homo sapiens]
MPAELLLLLIVAFASPSCQLQSWMIRQCVAAVSVWPWPWPGSRSTGSSRSQPRPEWK